MSKIAGVMVRAEGGRLVENLKNLNRRYLAVRSWRWDCERKEWGPADGAAENPKRAIALLLEGRGA
jgi:hypothetical protein